MGRPLQSWPIDTHNDYQIIYNELQRIQAMLRTCLAEAEIDNPYLFEDLLPNAKKRFYRIILSAQEIELYAPEGSGNLPKWLKVTKKTIRLCSLIYQELDSHELQEEITSQRFPTVVEKVKSIVSIVDYIQSQLIKIPLERASIKLTTSGFVEVVLK